MLQVQHSCGTALLLQNLRREAFYVPRSNPDGISVNFRCVDASTFEHFQIEDFDGQNWEQHADKLVHLSQDVDNHGTPGNTETP